MNELTSSALDKRSSLRVRKGPLFYLKRDWLLYLLLLPGVAYFILFKYLPIFGIIISFQNYKPFFGVSGIFTSEWFGLYWFRRFMSSYYFWRLMRNTFLLSFYSLLWSFPSAILLALLINELQNKHFKKLVQTISYLPHFITTVVMCSIILQMFDARTGLFNAIMQLFGVPARNYMGIESAFKHIYVWTNVWQGVGYSSIIYIASLRGVSSELHEAALIDGATLVQRIRHVDIPSLLPTVCVLLIMSCGSLLSVGYEKVYLLQNSMNLNASEVINTYVYKQGLTSTLPQYSSATAIGLFVAIVNLILLATVNGVTGRLSGSSLW